jgi:hypothetical protein
MKADKQTEINSQTRMAKWVELVETTSDIPILRGSGHCYYIISSNLMCGLPNHVGSDLEL